MDPRKDLKQHTETVQTRTYYTRQEKRKGEMNRGTFDMVAWDNINIAPKGTRNILRCGTQKKDQVSAE